MTHGTTALDVRVVNAHTSIIGIAGDVTAAREAALMEAYNAAATAGTRTVILDFSELEYMNSTGIGLLVTLLVRANRAQQKLLACGFTDHYRQILQLTRLDEAIGIYDTEADAIAAAES
jgi:anti-sigma B factor antagonist